MTGRLIGLALLVLGLTIGWVFGPVPHESPDAAELTMAAAIVSPISIVIGLLLFVAGDRLYTVINSPAKTSRQKTIMISLYGIAAAAGLCGLVWYNSIIPIF